VTALIRELFHHQAWADTAILKAADGDARLIGPLHHIVMVQRLFLSLFLKRPLDIARESAIPESFDRLELLFRVTHEEELSFVDRLDPGQLDQTIDVPFFPGLHPSLAEALMQVVLHSQNHRGQCLTRLREFGRTPPALDFIVWLKDDRPAPDWVR
jgi:uncharacterized damage-inducible protein DinB